MRFKFILFILTVFFNVNFGFSQCKGFAKTECKPQLGSFIHDGNYNGVVLNLGEEVELHKAFFSGQKYRMVVCPEEHLPPVHFKIMNSDLEVIFDNKEEGFVGYYDFELDKSATLIISLKFIKEKDKEFDRSINGCVAMLFGLEM